MKNFMKEFKAFIARGNVMDMAVGIIIGGAFSSIVSSLVEDIINPLLGCFVSMDFSAWKIPLVGDAALGIGNFINAVISFLIMAFILLRSSRSPRNLQLPLPRSALTARARSRSRRQDARTAHLSFNLRTGIIDVLISKTRKLPLLKRQLFSYQL